MKATNHRSRTWFQLTKALAEYRQGHFNRSAEWAQRTLASSGEVFERDVSAEAVLAMAYQGFHQDEQARAALTRANDIVRSKLVQPDNGDLGRDWVDGLVMEILRNEAGFLIKGAPQ